MKRAMCPIMETNATYTLVTTMADTVRFPLALAESSLARIYMKLATPSVRLKWTR